MAFPFLAAIPVIGKIIEKVIGVVDQAVLDKDQANKLKADIQMAVMAMDHQEFTDVTKAQADIIKAEAQGESWLQRSWRPILMLIFMLIIANNYIIFPYASMFTDKTVILELPPAMWNLLSIGVGGYIVGRSGEKILSKWKGNGDGE